MGFFSAELESMVELYQRETAQLMEEFDSKQAKTMQNNSFSAQDINAFFRVAHTIKSSAAMMGLTDISNCTHKMEDFFSLLRDDPERAKGFESSIFDLMYLFSDYVRKENRRVAAEDFVPGSADNVIAAIQADIDIVKGNIAAADGVKTEDVAAESAETPMAEQPPAKDIEMAAERGKSVWRVMFRPNCQMENVRAFMLVRELESLCSYIKTSPENLEASGAAEQISQNGLILNLSTDNEEEALGKLSASPYVLSVDNISHGEKQTADETSAKAEPEKQSEEDSGNRQNKFSMVAWSHILQLQNITGELITANTILGASIKSQNGSSAMDNQFQTMKRLFQELEKVVAAVSMMPVSSAVPQYQRLVRDVAVKEGKKIKLQVIGDELEVDRNLLDTLANPIIHLLRNAADHGIEEPEARKAAGKDPRGTIVLKFQNQSDNLIVTVEDDGQGMDPQRLLKKAAERGALVKDENQYSLDEIFELALLPGLSTNEETNQYSGRGVGMDVAQSVVTSLGGSVSISSRQGYGSSIKMEVPVSMTSSECIRFSVGPYTCLIPIRTVVRVYSYAEAESYLQTIDGHTWFQTEEMLPVIDMFALYGAEMIEKKARLIYIKDEKGSAALLTGPIAGQQTAVEKPLPSLIGQNYRKHTGMSGCTITETGSIGIMLSPDWLIRMCGKEIAENGK